MVVATRSFDDPNIVVMVVITMLVSMALLFPIAWALGRRGPRQPELRVTWLSPAGEAREKEPWV
jgi:hypothetical protein